jgi:hypothetical protein
MTILYTELDTARVELEHSCAFLKSLPESVWVSYPDELHTRRALLLATSGRVLALVRAITILSVENFDEEVCALSRMLTEVIVNGLYLQIASSIELLRFMHFDAQSTELRVQKRADAPEAEENRAAYEANQDRLRNLTQRKPNAFSWSEHGLSMRARMVDEMSELPVMEMIADNVSALTNFSVHGTLLALATSVPESVGHQNPTASRKRFHTLAIQYSTLATSALSQACLAILAHDLNQA